MKSAKAATAATAARAVKSTKAARAVKSTTAAKAVKAARPDPARAAFAGFDRDAPRFFHELAAEMSREWFAAHKAEYEARWVAPMTALFAEVRAGLAPAYRGTTLAAPKLFRIHRDVRFAKDKAPYKTHCAGVLMLGEGAVMETGAALYLQLGLEEYAGAGYWDFTPDQLARWRKAVIDDRRGGELAALVAGARAAGQAVDAHQTLARTPPGLDPAHPRAELLRQKGCVLSFPPIPRGLIHRPAFAGWLVEQGRAAAPVVRWLERHVAGGA